MRHFLRSVTNPNTCVINAWIPVTNPIHHTHFLGSFIPLTFRSWKKCYKNVGFITPFHGFYCSCYYGRVIKDRSLSQKRFLKSYFRFYPLSCLCYWRCIQAYIFMNDGSQKETIFYLLAHFSHCLLFGLYYSRLSFFTYLEPIYTLVFFRIMWTFWWLLPWQSDFVI